MLKGIDVSNNNGYPWDGATEVYYKNSDFMIAKATQGNWFVDAFCDTFIQRAIGDGKLWGFYHYAEGGDAKEEARFFHDHTKGYDKKGIPCLDWESIQNPSFGDSDWCKEFVDEYYALTGVWPLIYVQASAIWQVANCANYCGLWVASYQSALTWDLSPWPYYTIWQYTSSPCDLNYGNISADGWNKIAQGNGESSQPKAPEYVTEFAKAVLKGEYGNGEERKNKIYNAVQSEVNRLCK